MCINVHFFKQKENSKECWFACAMMMLNYYGKVGDSYEDLKDSYGKKMFPNPNDPDCEVPLSELMKTSGGSDDLIGMLLADKEVPTAICYRQNMNKEQFNKKVEDSLKVENPVIIGLDWKNDGGHFVIACGYDKDTWKILDPLEELDKLNQYNARLKKDFVQIATAIIVTDVK